MSFRNFDYPSVLKQLELVELEQDLFPDQPSFPVPNEISDRLRYAADLAAGNDTEAARTSLIIGPLLMDLRRLTKDRFGLFVGFELNTPNDKDLSGVCDFILTQQPRLRQVTAPIMAIMEAKRSPLRSGFGQCIAAMVAAQKFNKAENQLIPFIYGAVSSGTNWIFLRLVDDKLVIDLHEYQIAQMDRLFGMLHAIVTS